ncbi:AbrB/MazE/SpoVT family DNA-binding domain-containing protein [Thermoflexus sp.]|jgi:putative addiction module antidote|uniref:AbrB/MazE/SpoVT family DNA-binding domain-containing protein n=1 Tax=Thermoflexus sp. TaxID=1969742 RepID=UPI003BFCBC03
MVQKIFRSGNSLVVSLPKDILDMLGLDEGAEVSVEIDREQRRIIITPAGLVLPGVNEEFARQVTEFIEQYRPALEALARR